MMGPEMTAREDALAHRHPLWRYVKRESRHHGKVFLLVDDAVHHDDDGTSYSSVSYRSLVTADGEPEEPRLWTRSVAGFLALFEPVMPTGWGRAL